MEPKKNMTIGARLRSIRECAGITQKELAEDFGIYYGNVISMYEAEKRALPVDVLVRYSERFNVTTDWILKGEGTIPKTDELDRVVESIRWSRVRDVAINQLKALMVLA